MYSVLSVRQFHWYLTLVVLFTVGIQAHGGGDCLSVALVAIPDCAKSCFLEQAPSIGCDGLDFVCQCQKHAAFYSLVEACVVDVCESSEYQKVIDGAKTVCGCAIDAKDYHQATSGSLDLPSSTSFISPPPLPTSFISPPPSAAPSGEPSAPPVVVVTTTAEDDSDSSPTETTSAPASTSTSEEVENGADHTSSSRLGLMVSVFGAALVFALL
ncbi:hypothetical protein QBC36DRAFT_198376 [Triangularia setosa]|uniref:CFEM domain-containing protein n=1 Tax=Triangularia setosa TaxID=2587417 RepID=A0AAN6VY65_9PEZI|nr:hypothetical protein QBC36DRAFT_198376 [Podospora setosa]